MRDVRRGISADGARETSRKIRMENPGGHQTSGRAQAPPTTPEKYALFAPGSTQPPVRGRCPSIHRTTTDRVAVDEPPCPPTYAGSEPGSSCQRYCSVDNTRTGGRPGWAGGPSPRNRWWSTRQVISRLQRSRPRSAGHATRNRERSERSSAGLPAEAPSAVRAVQGLPSEAASAASVWRRMVRKGGLEPPRYCYRQPLKPEEVEDERSRPRSIGVGCHLSRLAAVGCGRLFRHGLHDLASVRARAVHGRSSSVVNRRAPDSATWGCPRRLGSRPLRRRNCGGSAPLPEAGWNLRQRNDCRARHAQTSDLRGFFRG